MALNKLDSVTWVVVDSTARAHFKTKGNAELSKDDLNKALDGTRVSVRSVKKLSLAAPTQEVEIAIKGMA